MKNEPYKVSTTVVVDVDVMSCIDRDADATGTKRSKIINNILRKYYLSKIK